MAKSKQERGKSKAKKMAKAKTQRAVDSVPSEEELEKIMDQLVEEGFLERVEEELPQRWYKSQVGDWLGILDSFTGLFAPYLRSDSVPLDDEELDSDLEQLLSEEATISDLSWRVLGYHDVIAFPTAANEALRYMPVWNEDVGAAVYDRKYELVSPLPQAHLDTAIDTAAMLNEELDTTTLAWVSVEEWAHPVETEAPEEGNTFTKEHVGQNLAPVRVYIVSSRAWAWKSVVREVLQSYWNGIGNPPLVLITSGSPYGAEAVAYELAQGLPDQVTHEIVADEDLSRDKIDYAFAFVSNHSEGASLVLDTLKLMKVPTHIMTETSAVVDEAWANR